MKANPGGTVTGEAIIGRKKEIADIWTRLEKRSVVLTAERRVGKTCVLRKMYEIPRNGWLPLFCWVESDRHPIDCVGKIFSEANRLEARSDKGIWLGRIRSAYRTLAGAEISGWKLPQLRTDWKSLLNALFSDISENTGNRILIVIDEFPMMISNIIKDHGGPLGMEFLDALREIRQKYEPSDQIRFLMSGSIGLHLILQQLKSDHEYKGNPVNDMSQKVLSGMTEEDVKLMCVKYLAEEGIIRNDQAEFDRRMFEATDGLPLYIQYVCERFQDSKRREVSPDDIDAEIRAMMDDREIQWFNNAAERIGTYYASLQADHRASIILKMLSHEESFVSEGVIIDDVRSQMTVEYDDEVLSTLELLLDDNYIVRDTSTGERRYRFRYEIMRKWWRINKG
jgi:hypothetical protein